MWELCYRVLPVKHNFMKVYALRFSYRLKFMLIESTNKVCLFAFSWEIYCQFIVAHGLLSVQQFLVENLKKEYSLPKLTISMHTKVKPMPEYIDFHFEID